MNLEKPFQCTECDFRFTTNAAKKIHLSKHSKGKTFNCPLCDTQFSDPAKLRKHRLDVCSAKTAINYTLCEECGMKFYRSITRAIHMFNMHGIKDTQCFECNYKPVDLRDLKRHAIRHHGKPNEIICTECGITCDTKDQLMRHMKTHKVELIACKECDFVGKSTQGLNIHITFNHRKGKSDEDLEIKDLINKPSKNKRQKALHTQENTATGSETEVIGYQVIVNNSEEVITTARKPIRCMECDYVAGNDEDLTKHIEEHIANAMSFPTQSTVFFLRKNC